MAIAIQRVQPGDLITASLFNDLVGHLEGLEARVKALEETGDGGAGAVVITALSPSPVRVGQDLTIVGENFGFTIGAHRVRFNGVPPPAFRAGSGDTVLICQVPELSGLKEEGTPVTLTVNNATSTASRVVTVRPPELAQAGNIDLVYRGASPDPLTAGVVNEFEFQLDSDALLPATMEIGNFQPRTTAGAPLAWPTAVLNAARVEIPSDQVTVAPGAQVTFFLRVSIPAGTNGTTFVVRADAHGGGLAASSGDLTFTVGQSADPDPSIFLSPSASAGVSGAEISAPVGTMRTVNVEADFSAPGSYNVSLTSLGGLTNWTTALVQPTAQSPVIPVDPDDLGEDGVTDRTIRFNVRPNAGGTNGQLRLTVQRQGESRSRSFTFDMRVT